MRIKFSGPAMREAEEAALWYWERSGDRVRGHLLAEIERARQILRDQPGIGTPGVRGTRKLPLDKFPVLAGLSHRWRHRAGARLHASEPQARVLAASALNKARTQRVRLRVANSVSRRSLL